jgi:hypothetical protein
MSAEDANTSMAYDATFAFVRGLCCYACDFVFAYVLRNNLSSAKFARTYFTYQDMTL